MLPDKISEKPANQNVDEILIDGFDHVEFYVGNAWQAAYYYSRAFGFDISAYRGLETGEREAVSYVLQQEHITFVVTGALLPESAVAEHVKRHGDGAKTVALKVRDAKKAYATAIARGAKAATEFVEYEGPDGIFCTGSVYGYGETIHKFVERQAYTGIFAPGFKAMLAKPLGTQGAVGLAAIDHVVGSVERERLEEWIDFYKNVFGFYVYQYFDETDISTQYSALVSPVMANKSGSIKLPLVAPAKGLKKSQVEEYLQYYQTAGVQHIALATRKIIPSVAELKRRGIQFLTVPRTYYEMLGERVGVIDEDMKQIAKLGILVDREDEGYLLQTFTRTPQDRPTLFFEVIQRKGAKGFGKGNFKALFESLEHEQELRGNL